MLKTFNQFINESVDGRKISDIKQIDDAYSNFIEFMKIEFNNCIGIMSRLLQCVDNAIELLNNEFGDIIVGKPTIEFAEPHGSNIEYDDMSAIRFCFKTNVPFEDEEMYDIYEKKMDDFTEQLKNICYSFEREYGPYRLKDFSMRASVPDRGDEDGNFKIYLDIKEIIYARELVEFYFSISDEYKKDAAYHIGRYIFKK